MDFNTVRELLGDKAIVDELIQYLSTDKLNDFTQTLVDNNDIEDNEVTDIYDWYHANYDDDDLNEVKQCICENCDYSAEPHQLCEEDLIDSINHVKIMRALEHDFDIEINDPDNIDDFIETILVNEFNEDKSAFLI